MSYSHQHLAVLVGLILGSTCLAYDPLAVESSPVATVEFTVNDTTRDREIPLLVYLPQSDEPAPVVLFSHGLGGTRQGCSYLGKHWARRGYVAVFVQHPGSDSSVWKDVPRRQRRQAMDAAASGENFRLRVKDIPAVLDQLATWNSQAGHRLGGRLDLDHVGMSGHSFGAVTTQAVSGQRFGRLGALFTDQRVDAAVAFSPSSARRGGAEAAFGKVEQPWLLMTGTHDVSAIGQQPVKSRLAVYAALPADGSKYELVLDKAEHSAFTDRPLPDDTQPRNPNHHRSILAISTAFWDTYLCGNKAAEAWLHGDGPKTVTQPADRWQHK